MRLKKQPEVIFNIPIIVNPLEKRPVTQKQAMRHRKKLFENPENKVRWSLLPTKFTFFSVCKDSLKLGVVEAILERREPGYLKIQK